MNLFKNCWNKIKEPRGVPLVLFYIFFVLIVAITLALVIIIPEQTVVHFILYPLAGASLAYFIYTIVIFAPRRKKNLIEFLKKFKFTNAVLEDYGFRTLVFGSLSFLFNVTYVAFVGVFAIITRSAWYISISAYYLVLALMKGNVIYSRRKHNTDVKRARAYRYSGILFVFMTIVFSGVITLIYTSNMAFQYAGLMIYAVAAYTFYKLTLAIVNIVKAKSHNDLYIQNIRNINLASALISIIVLQVAMFQAFSPENNTSIANALTGGAVSLAILIMGVYMIIKANKLLREDEILSGE